MIDMRHLPASLRNKPHIRALSMKVYPHTRNSMIVLGGSTPHEVFAYGDKLKCDCTAAQYGQYCAHVAAIHHAHEQEKKGKTIESMFTVDRSSAAERGTPVPLPRKQKQLYAGLFSGWFTHDGQYGISIGIKCLVTHTPAGKAWETLDQITEALTFVNPKWWHNSKKNESSHFLAFTHAVTQIDVETLVKMDNDQIKTTLNDSIGCGILFAASIVEHKGAEVNNIDKDSFDAPDAAFARLAQKMREKVKPATSKDGFTFISEPKPVYAAEGEATPTEDEQDFADSVPF